MNYCRMFLPRIAGPSLALGLIVSSLFPQVAIGGVEQTTVTTGVLAIVNEDTITTADLDSELVAVHSTQTAEEREHFHYRKLLDKLVNDRLIIQEAKSLALDQEDWLVKVLDEYRADNAIRYFVSDDFRPDLTVDTAAVIDMFKRNYRKMQLRTVAVADSMQAEKLDLAVANGADMDSLARKVSLDVQSLRGGLNHDKYQADIESSLLTIALPLKVGELSKPFRYRNSYAFLRVESRTPADIADLEKFRPVIEKSLKRTSRSRQWDEFVATLAGKYPVSIDSAAINLVLADSALLFTEKFVDHDTIPILTVAGDLTLTESELRTATSRTAMNMGNQPIRMIMAKTLDDSEERLTLLAAARDKGYLDDGRVARHYQKSLDSALIEMYLKETVVSQIKFKWSEFEEYYNQHLDDFRRDTQYQLERIQVSDSTKVAEVAQRLADGADFNFIANQYDPNPDRETQADEWVTLASFPESLSKQIEQLEIGQSTQPFALVNGFLFLRLKDKRLGQPKPIKDVEMRIREVMFQRKFNELLDKALGTLKANSHIEYHQDEIDKYFGSES